MIVSVMEIAGISIDRHKIQITLQLILVRVKQLDYLRPLPLRTLPIRFPGTRESPGLV